MAKYLAEVSDDRRRQKRRKFLLCALQLLRVLSLMAADGGAAGANKIAISLSKAKLKNKCAKCASVYC